jgi:hypothetical protein
MGHGQTGCNATNNHFRLPGKCGLLGPRNISESLWDILDFHNQYGPGT